MCMWGSDRTPDCFINNVVEDPGPGNPVWEAAENAEAALKRESILTQVSRHEPDVITINEGCENDIQSVAAQAGYEVRTVDTGHDCTMGRGNSVNAQVSTSEWSSGDVNTSVAGDNCAPSRYHGLKDTEWTAGDQQANPTDGLQHIYYTANGFWRQSCGWVYSVEHTDHKGFLLELGKSAPSGEDDSDCGVREIR